jgi:hypothetical protein
MKNRAVSAHHPVVGILLEPVQLAVPESDTWVVGSRRGNELERPKEDRTAGDMRT